MLSFPSYATAQKNTLLRLKVLAIEAFGTRHRIAGYNIAIGGDLGPAKDDPLTIEWRTKLSVASTRRWQRDGKQKLNELQIEALRIGRIKRQGPCKPETKEKISAKLKGRKIGPRYIRTAETNRKLSLAMKGRKPTPKQLALLEDGRRRRWEINHIDQLPLPL